MSDRKFNVRIYQVVPPKDAGPDIVSFSDIIRISYGHWHKTINIGGANIRLEHYKQYKDYHLLNFGRLRYEGPSKTTEGGEIEPFVLNDDDRFATEASMLYDEVTELAFLEVASGVISASQITEYFQKFNQLSDKYKYSLVSRLDENAWNKARNFQTVRRLKTRVAVPVDHKTDRDLGLDMAKALARQYDAEIIEVTLSVKVSGGSLGMEKFWQLINRITSRDNDNGVEKVQVRGKGPDDQNLIDISLFHQSETREYTLKIGDERKVPYEDRWNALIKVMREFRAK